MELDTKRIEDAIVAEVADKMIGDEELYNRAKTAISERIDRLWKETAEASIRAEVGSAITAGFEKTYQAVNSFGEPTGKPTTIRAELEKLIGGYWNEQVGRDGKPSSYNTVTRAEWMMTQLVASDFKDGMKQHIVNLGGALKDGLRLELHGTVNRLLSDIFHVRSADDQAVNMSDSSVIRDKAQGLK